MLTMLGWLGEMLVFSCQRRLVRIFIPLDIGATGPTKKFERVHGVANTFSTFVALTFEVSFMVRIE